MLLNGDTGVDGLIRHFNRCGYNTRRGADFLDVMSRSADLVCARIRHDGPGYSVSLLIFRLPIALSLFLLSLVMLLALEAILQQGTDTAWFEMITFAMMAGFLLEGAIDAISLRIAVSQVLQSAEP